jgi:hypothetical protein
MNKFLSMTSAVAVRATFLAIALLVAGGCGNQTVKLTSEQTKSFDTVPSEVKQAWDKALTADKANDYVNAQKLLDNLKQMQLNDEQKQALETERATFDQRLWQAAEKNDPAAVKAVQEINKSMGNGRQ